MRLRLKSYLRKAKGAASPSYRCCISLRAGAVVGSVGIEPDEELGSHTVPCRWDHDQPPEIVSFEMIYDMFPSRFRPVVNTP